MQAFRRVRQGLASLALLSLTTLCGGAQAAMLEKTFAATVADGPFAGVTGYGTFVYDTALLTGTGEETLSPVEGLLLNFNFLGQLYSADNDIDFTGFPQIEFVDGTPTHIDYVLNLGVNGVSFGDPSITGVEVLGTFAPGSAQDFTAPIFVTSVPEPAEAAMFGAGLLMLSAWRRRQSVRGVAPA